MPTPNFIEISKPSQVKHNKIDSKTVNFFKRLYSHPQNITIRFDSKSPLLKRDPFAGQNKTLIEQKRIYNPLSPLKKQHTYNMEKVNIAEESDSFISIEKSQLIEEALKSIRVYGIFDGRGRMLIIRKMRFGTLTDSEKLVANQVDYTKKSTRLKWWLSFLTADKIFKNQRGAQPQDVGLFFMNQDDAELFLLKTWEDDNAGCVAKRAGFTIHSLSLGSVYPLTRDISNQTAYRIVPDLNELASSSRFDPFIRKKLLTKKPSHFSTPEALVRGVPVYVIQVRGKGLVPLTPIENRQTLTTSEKEIRRNFVFFDEVTALKFLNTSLRLPGENIECRQSTFDRLERSITFDKIFGLGIKRIKAIPLEIYLNQWEKKLHLQSEDSIDQKDYITKTIFVPSAENEYDMNLEYLNTKKYNSTSGKVIRYFFIKIRTVWFNFTDIVIG